MSWKSLDRERERGQFGQERGRQFNRCSRTRLLLDSTNDPDLASHPRSRSRFRLPPPALALSPSKYKKKIAGKKALAIAQAGSDYDPALYASKVDAAIASAKGNTMVFSWSGCPFCKKAKALLDSKGAEYSVLELDQMDDGQKYRAALAERTGRTSMPSIFIGGEGGFIGGFGDGSPGLKPLNDSGELDGKLKAAGAL